MKKLLIISAFLCVSVILIFFLITSSLEKYYPVPDHPDYQRNLLTNDGVLGYQIRKGGEEVIFLTSDYKNNNVFSFNLSKNSLDKLNTYDIPVKITVNSHLLGFAPSFADLDGNIYFEFGTLIKISPDNKIAIYSDYRFDPDGIAVSSNTTGDLTEKIRPGKVNDYKLPASNPVSLALLAMDKTYKISTSPSADITYVCYFQVTFGDNSPCKGYRLLLYADSKKIVLPNFDKDKETSKYDSGFIYVPYDKNFFMADRSFIFLSQSNKLYRFK